MVTPGERVLALAEMEAVCSGTGGEDLPEEWRESLARSGVVVELVRRRLADGTTANITLHHDRDLLLGSTIEGDSVFIADLGDPDTLVERVLEEAALPETDPAELDGFIAELPAVLKLDADALAPEFLAEVRNGDWLQVTAWHRSDELMEVRTIIWIEGSGGLWLAEQMEDEEPLEEETGARPELLAIARASNEDVILAIADCIVSGPEGEEDEDDDAEFAEPVEEEAPEEV